MVLSQTVPKYVRFKDIFDVSEAEKAVVAKRCERARATLSEPP